MSQNRLANCAPTALHTCHSATPSKPGAGRWVVIGTMAIVANRFWRHNLPLIVLTNKVSGGYCKLKNFKDENRKNSECFTEGQKRVQKKYGTTHAATMLIDSAYSPSVYKL